MGLFDMFGMGAALAGDARAPKLAPPESFFPGCEVVPRNRHADKPRNPRGAAPQANRTPRAAPEALPLAATSGKA